MNMYTVGNYCKNFRLNVLKMGLTEFSNKNNEKVKNLWAFEQGNANNIKYLAMYHNSCKTRNDSIEFLKGLFKGGKYVKK